MDDDDNIDLLRLEISNIEFFLAESKKEGLEIEVLMWAFRAIKEDPEISASRAMQIGYNEWIK